MMTSTAWAERFNSRAKNHQKLFFLIVVIMIVLFVVPSHTFGVTYLTDGDYLYLKTGTTTCSIEKYQGTGGEVIIPSSIKGLKVTMIGPYAFYKVGSTGYEGYGLTKVTIPNTVKTIRNDAFSRNYSLTSIVIPNSVRDINYRAFDWCYYLTSVKLGTGVRFIGEKAFYDCPNLVKVTIPPGVNEIGPKAFGYLYYANPAWAEIKNSLLKMSVYSGTAGYKYAKNNGFTIVTVRLGRPVAKVTSPKSKTAKVSWARVSYADGYVVQMKSSSSGSYSTIKSATSALSYTKTSLKSRKIYYFRVKAYKKLANGSKLYSSYSAAVKVRVK